MKINPIITSYRSTPNFLNNKINNNLPMQPIYSVHDVITQLDSIQTYNPEELKYILGILLDFLHEPHNEMIEVRNDAINCINDDENTEYEAPMGKYTVNKKVFMKTTESVHDDFNWELIKGIMFDNILTVSNENTNIIAHYDSKNSTGPSLIHLIVKKIHGGSTTLSFILNEDQELKGAYLTQNKLYRFERRLIYQNPNLPYVSVSDLHEPIQFSNPIY